ncbi:aminotransferase class I/II-fold pyridoxal phosphate-dependent enzyme [Pseudomonas sp. SST3]|uniref:aminotransferase class I/II-fold pyridoxal phosphate-dependent enzyme n=1 Tax=Pseudomonas sp. SST3 TaxID=2267882 RepID=UPI00406D4D5F
MGWVSTFLQRLALQLLTSPAMRRKFSTGGAAYIERHTALLTLLRKKGFRVHGGAGLNLWLPIADERAVAERLFDAGWLVRTGRDFCVAPQSGIRITSSKMTPQQSIVFVDALLAARHAVQRHSPLELEAKKRSMPPSTSVGIDRLALRVES